MYVACEVPCAVSHITLYCFFCDTIIADFFAGAENQKETLGKQPTTQTGGFSKIGRFVLPGKKTKHKLFGFSGESLEKSVSKSVLRGKLYLHKTRAFEFFSLRFQIN